MWEISQLIPTSDYYLNILILKLENLGSIIYQQSDKTNIRLQIYIKLYISN